MKSRPPRRPRPSPARQPPENDARIDAIYGLEPVIDPANEPRPEGEETPGARVAAVQCPYCGEPFETLVDYSAGSSSYIEDCQVCCRPIEFHVEREDGGALRALQVRRLD